MSPMNSSGSNALLILQCHCLGGGTNLYIVIYHIWHLHIQVPVLQTFWNYWSYMFLTVFINKNYFLWELNAQNLMIMMMMMISCYNLLWYIKGPRLLWIYFHLYQHQCIQNTLKLQEISVFNFLEIMWLMVSHQILNLTRQALFQNMLPYKVLLCQHPERPINIHNLHL
jgi:hypothetical protein